jgi:hypothetical protein
VASAFPLAFDAVDLTPPLAEDTFSKNTIQKFDFHIQETELRLLRSLGENFALSELSQPVEKFQPQPTVFPP